MSESGDTDALVRGPGLGRVVSAGYNLISVLKFYNTNKLASINGNTFTEIESA